MPFDAAINRRALLGGTAALGGMFAAGCVATQARAARAGGPKRPNIVFIMADDMGHADVSFNGQRDFETPRIDAIATAGVRFERAYANSAVCSATRTALITGRYQYRLPIGLEEPLAGKSPPGVGLPPEMPTLPTLLAAAGTAQSPRYPLDGANLLPGLTARTAPAARRLYWRFKANHQCAMIDGDYKYLKIAGNEYLFNVESDPLERANIKAREPARFAAMAAAWKAWNQTMLPEIDASFTEGVTADELADHIGSAEVIKTADPGD